MAKTLKLNLNRDQKTIRKYIEGRAKDYPHYVNRGPGNDEHPISVITIGFYASQAGYVSLVFDTRPDGGDNHGFDNEWTQYLDDDVNICWIRSWCDAFDAISEGQPVTIVRHDLIEMRSNSPASPDVVNTYFGDMLVDLVFKMQNEGFFRTLPLAEHARIEVAEFDDYFYWPHPGKREYSDKKSLDLIRRLGQLQ